MRLQSFGDIIYNNITSLYSRSRGQLQFLSILIFLFLLPTAFIIAENVTLNSSFTGSFLNSTLNNSLNLTNKTNNNQTINITNVTINITPTFNKTINQTLNTTNTTLNITKTNITNVTINKTINQTTNTTNKTINITNKTVKKKVFGTSELKLSLILPEKITRGESFILKVIADNIGDNVAKNIKFIFDLPTGFSILEHGTECKKIYPKETCEKVVIVQTDLHAIVGHENIKLGVSYE